MSFLFPDVGLLPSLRVDDLVAAGLRPMLVGWGQSNWGNTNPALLRGVTPEAVREDVFQVSHGAIFGGTAYDADANIVPFYNGNMPTDLTGPVAPKFQLMPLTSPAQSAFPSHVGVGPMPTIARVLQDALNPTRDPARALICAQYFVAGIALGIPDASRDAECRAATGIDFGCNSFAPGWLSAPGDRTRTDGSPGSATHAAYANLVTLVRTAMVTHRAVPIAVVGHQGESDGGNQDYERAFFEFINLLRTDLMAGVLANPDRLPYFHGTLPQIIRDLEPLSSFAHDNMAAAVPNSYLVDLSAETDILPDNVHFSGPAQIRNGERYGAEILRQLPDDLSGDDAPPVTAPPTDGNGDGDGDSSGEGDSDGLSTGAIVGIVVAVVAVVTLIGVGVYLAVRKAATKDTASPLLKTPDGDGEGAAPAATSPEVERSVPLPPSPPQPPPAGANAPVPTARPVTIPGRL